MGHRQQDGKSNMSASFPISKTLHERACRVIPGGVNSGIRKMEQPVPRAEAKFAEEAARKRIAQGKSPFFDQRVDTYPKWSPEQHWQEPAIMPKGDK
jgi:hypothetical protein